MSTIALKMELFFCAFWPKPFYLILFYSLVRLPFLKKAPGKLEFKTFYLVSDLGLCLQPHGKTFSNLWGRWSYLLLQHSSAMRTLGFSKYSRQSRITHSHQHYIFVKELAFDWHSIFCMLFSIIVDEMQNFRLIVQNASLNKAAAIGQNDRGVFEALSVLLLP